VQVPLPTTLAENLRAVAELCAAAARRAGRDPASVRIVAVTKSVPAAVAAEIARLGAADLGENRADDLEAKAAELAAAGVEPRWHFVGHLQRNKARAVVRRAHLVHSVDSVRLLETLDRLAGEEGRELDVLAQVKLADEATKSGLDPRELADFLRRARAARHVRVLGLMAMAPLERDARAGSERARDVFRRCAQLAREHRASFPAEPELSMGMSDDFEVAIEEGATLVRIGSRLFEGAGGGA
jgi:pyridoxal phosphate enzyme (YggS family)